MSYPPLSVSVCLISLKKFLKIVSSNNGQDNQIPIVEFRRNFYFKLDRKGLQRSKYVTHMRYKKKRTNKNI